MVNSEWDPAKDRANFRKHGVSFDQASSVFFDDYAVQFYDDGHSISEDRFTYAGNEQSDQYLTCKPLRARGWKCDSYYFRP